MSKIAEYINRKWNVNKSFFHDIMSSIQRIYGGKSGGARQSIFHPIEETEFQ